MSTSMHPTSILTLNDSNKKVDQTTHRTRPDIMFSIYLCACFQVNTRESHLIVVNYIFRYLKCTTNLCLWFKKFDEYRIKGYCDVDYNGDQIERKSISGGCHFIGANLVSWASKRQGIIALSAAEA
ncbi:hypothetical protein CR513_36367, partial [Mucuna pruriens]